MVKYLFSNKFNQYTIMLDISYEFYASMQKNK